MKKTYTLTQIDPGGTVGWQIFSTGKGCVNISLTGEKMFYFAECLKGDTMRVPAAQGAKLCEDQKLTLTIEGDVDPDITFLSSDVLDAGTQMAGRSFYCIGRENLRVHITVWNKMGAPVTASALQRFFYTYLTLKDKYLFNYLSDPTVNAWYKTAPATGYVEWFESKRAGFHSELEEFKLALAFLLYYDAHCTRKNLVYSLSGDLLMAEGPKIWGEPRITIESCPFSNIRGVILNEVEKAAFNKALGDFSDISLFSKGELNVAAAHGDVGSVLDLRVSKPMGFENLGIHVLPKNPDDEVNVIAKAVEGAADGGASVLIFPELSIEEDKVDFLKTVLARKSGNLKMVVGGSSYFSEGQDWFNGAPILVKRGGTWQKAAAYKKMIPFSMGYNETVAKEYNIDTKKYPLNSYKTLSEDFTMEDNVTILPFADCVVGIAICRDALDLLDSHNPVHKYCDFVDVMLVISDNNGDSNMFVGTAECLARWHNCATVYTNSVAEAKRSGETDIHLEVSFGLYPFKGQNASDSTSVSGEITYIKPPFPEKKTQEGMAQLLFSTGISYLSLEEDGDAITYCCKIYTLKAPK